MTIKAVNEIIIEKTNQNIIVADIKVNNKKLLTVSLDALLVSTQIGSSAYNSSMNGPLLLPGQNSMILNFGNPIFVFTRKLVFSSDYIIEIELNKEKYMNNIAKIFGDSNQESRLEQGGRIIMSLNKEDEFSLAKFKNKDYKSEWLEKIRKVFKWD